MIMCKYLTLEEQRGVAVTLLSLLQRKIELPAFRDDNKVYVSKDTGLGFIELSNIENFPELIAKREEIEKHFNALVYYVIGCDTDYGYMYNFLLTSKYEEDKELVVPCGNNYYRVWSYVWNKDREYLSEPGMIGVVSQGILPLIRVN